MTIKLTDFERHVLIMALNMFEPPSDPTAKRALDSIMKKLA